MEADKRTTTICTVVAIDHTALYYAICSFCERTPPETTTTAPPSSVQCDHCSFPKNTSAVPHRGSTPNPTKRLFRVLMSVATDTKVFVVIMFDRAARVLFGCSAQNFCDFAKLHPFSGETASKILEGEMLKVTLSNPKNGNAQHQRVVSVVPLKSGFRPVIDTLKELYGVFYSSFANCKLHSKRLLWTIGEREVDAVKRNADVHEIHKRTRFSSVSNSTLPKRIDNHDRIIWLGDLNYRLNLSYEKTRELISKNNWEKLSASDQLLRELSKGRAFEGWSEGILDFPPTYKYEQNSNKYYGEDPKIGRRTPAWCDRILSYGKGIRQVNYRRAEFKLSDHRPVIASYMIEVEVFSPRKLQKALTFTDAEIENDGIVAGMGIDGGINCLRITEDTYW